MRADAVSPELAQAVFDRDKGCVAPRLGGTFLDCWGRRRIEHVKAEPRMSKRAEPCLCRLVELCEGHTEPGMKAGYVWCTANREALRGYLASFGYTPHVEGHLDSDCGHADPRWDCDRCQSRAIHRRVPA